MTSSIKTIATSSPTFFIAAVVLGFFLPQGGNVTFFLILPALTAIFTVTLLCIPKGFFREPRKLLPAALLGNLMNYILLGNIIILGSIFFIRDEKIWTGMVLIAAMPSAIRILSLNDKIHADKLLTLTGLAGTYVAAVILIPLIGIAFLKYIPIFYTKLIVLVLALIVLPLLLSHIAVDRNWEARIESKAGLITNISYFIIYYTLTAQNAGLIGSLPPEIPLISAVAAAPIILASAVFFLIGKFYKIDERKVSSLLLLGTMKNYGLAGVIALYVFGNKPALPALIFSIFMFLYCVLMQIRTRLQNRPLPDPQET